MQIGKLTFDPLITHPELVAQPVQASIKRGDFSDGVFVAAIDPDLADTASFCEKYGIQPEMGANCIIVEAKRADKIWHAACLILASDMIDVNGKVRRELGARKISFAPKDTALKLTSMEYGGVTPLGLPADMPILIDNRVLGQEYMVIGGGIRGSKILVQTGVLESLEQAKVMDITK